MGVYDIVLVPCPKCGTELAFQTKSGPCHLDSYTLKDAPSDVLLNVNRHAPETCPDCGTQVYVELTVTGGKAKCYED